MRNLIQNIRDQLVSTEDTVCLQRAYLVTEAFRKHEDDPPVLKRAKAFAYILHNMDLDVESNPLLAGNTSSSPRAWMLIPEHGVSNDTQVVIENECLRGHLDGKIPEDLQQFWKDRSYGGVCGIGHLAVDLDRVVHEGLEAMIAEAEEHGSEGTPDERIYRQAMVITLKAVIDWAHRYADAAEQAVLSEGDPLRREAYRRVSEACRRVPARPAKSLFEALQAMALIHLAIAIEGHGMSVSIGLPDRVLAPFIGDNFDAEDATNVIAAFMLKVAANSLFGRGSKTQAITVGGVDPEGRDQCNAVTLCFLEACNRVRIGDPHLFVRWHANIASEVKERAVQMLADGVSMPLLISDDATAGGFMGAGVAPEDAWDYCVIGCNELGIPGRSAESATASSGSIQYLGIINEVLLAHADPDSIHGMPQLLDLVESHMHRRLRQSRENGLRHRQRTADQMPTPFTSALMRGCIQRGKDLLVGMDYHLPGHYERGTTNGANALAAIQELVFSQRSLRMSEIIQSMEDNFEDAAVRAKLLSTPKWGNDDESADRWAKELVAMRERVLTAIDTEFGGSPHVVCHVVRSLHHVDGRRIAASPDGRLAWTPVADSIGAQTGTAVAGPTGILKSVLKLNAKQNYRGGYNLNLTLPKASTTPDILIPLIEAFFAEGGQELQINCFDAETLKDARERPENYGDLVVRVAGFSTRFVDLSRAEQDELIERAEVLP